MLYVIGVNKSHFLLNVRLLKNIFSKTTTPSSRHIFSTTTRGIRIQRRVDVFSTTSYTSQHGYGDDQVVWIGK